MKMAANVQESQERVARLLPRTTPAVAAVLERAMAGHELSRDEGLVLATLPSEDVEALAAVASPTSPRPSPPPGAEREKRPARLAFPLRPLGGGGQGEVGTLGRLRSSKVANRLSAASSSPARRRCGCPRP